LVCRRAALGGKWRFQKQVEVAVRQTSAEADGGRRATVQGSHRSLQPEAQAIAVHQFEWALLELKAMILDLEAHIDSKTP
jgi:hypothetical protein